MIFGFQPSLLRSFGWQAGDCEGCPPKLRAKAGRAAGWGVTRGEPGPHPARALRSPPSPCGGGIRRRAPSLLFFDRPGASRSSIRSARPKRTRARGTPLGPEDPRASTLSRHRGVSSSFALLPAEAQGAKAGRATEDCSFRKSAKPKASRARCLRTCSA